MDDLGGKPIILGNTHISTGFSGYFYINSMTFLHVLIRFFVSFGCQVITVIGQAGILRACELYDRTFGCRRMDPEMCVCSFLLYVIPSLKLTFSLKD